MTNKRRLVVALATVLIPVAVPVIVGTSELASAATSNWYAVDLHAHSVVSADAIPDVGIIKRNAKQAGLSAVFLSDHNQGSDFSISTHTANHSFFANDLTRWTTVGANVGLVTAPVHTAGGSSIHVKDNGSKEGYLYTKRGGNFMPGTGSMTTKFSVYPVSLSGSASLYVSASIGGDNTISTPAGYTLAATGEPTVCKSVVLVWYLGAAPPTTGYNPTSSKCGAVKPAAVVKQFPISPSQCDQPVAVNTWITCTVDVTAAVNTIAATDKPYDYNAISYLKMAATGGADAYFDDYATDKGPLPGTILSRAGAEFAARNALLPQFTDPGTFAMYPSLEEGTNSHANRFNFNIQTAGEFVTGCSPSASCSYSAGIDGLLPTEISGYPAQLNHPGVPGGVTDAQAISTCPTGTNPACGADLMEVRERNMLRDWDSVLGTGEPLIGDWTTDDHSGSWNSLSPVTVIYAPSLSSDDLLHALFEGRAYNRQLGSGASRLRVVLNLDPLSVEPYPARYPVYVPTSQPTASMHVDISGIPTGDVVRWIANGVVVATDSPSAGSVVTTRSIPLAAASTAVRVEVGPSSDTTLAANPHGASEAIIFRRGPNGLPATTSVHVDRVTPGSAPASTRYWTKGVTSATWTAADEVLGLTLTDRPGSLAEVHVASATAPRTVTIGGATVTAAGSLGEFESARGPSWVVDAGTIRLKVPAVTGTDSAVISFGAGSGDLSPPTTPGTPLTTSVDSTSVALGWARSSDNVGVVAYDVRRNGVVVGSVAQPVSGDPSFTDLNLSPATSYTYAVTARDAAGNQTTSSPLSVTTPADGTPPSTPVATAVATATSVTLSWPQSTDNVAVTQYRVSRNGVGVGTVPQPSSGAVSFTDTGLAPVTSYSYDVTAMDAAANAATSATVVVTTLSLAAPGTFTFNSVADAKVDASVPTANYGTAALRVDASPDVRSYLRFDAAAITGTVQSATLRVWATSSQSSGYTVRSVADNGWIESGTGAITSANQPSGSISATVLGSSGPVVAGSWVTVDVVAMIAGPGTYSVVLQTTSTTALALASREDPLHPPQLVVTAT